MQSLLVPISVGELIDKITILRIKQKKVSDQQKLANIEHELNKLEATWNQTKDPNTNISDLDVVFGRTILTVNMIHVFLYPSDLASH